MSLYKDPVTTLLKVIGDYNGITLDPDDYDFGLPNVNATGTNVDQNTYISVSANNTVAPYQGSVQVFYNRLDLTDLSKLVKLQLQAPSVTNSHDILPYLNSRFGLNLVESDIVLVDAVDHGDYKSVVLTATAASIGWIGTVTLSVTQGDIPLENYLLTTALPGMDYPTPYATLPFAQFYSYWRDFSAHTEFLKTVTAGQVIPADLAAILTTVTGDTWALSGYSQFSLGGAVIKYAGSTANNGIFNDSYDYGLQITLNHDNAYGISGDLIIHFSEPVDPLAAA